MKDYFTRFGASAVLVTMLALPTSANAGQFNLAIADAPADGLLHHVSGRNGGRGDGVFGGAFPFSFKHGQFNYGTLGPRYQTLREQKEPTYRKSYSRTRGYRGHRSTRKIRRKY